jgi:hypothetical protein
MNALNPTLYARVTGFALAAVALLGIVLQLATNGKFIEGFLVFDWTHDLLHVALAGLALAAGFAAGGAYARNYARVFGIVYTGLAVAGFVSGNVVGFLGIHLELGENLVHAAIGVWGLAAGFTPEPRAAPATPRRA